MAKSKTKTKDLVPKSKAKTAYGLLSDIAKTITDEPKRYNQGQWLVTLNDDQRKAYEAYGDPAPKCGTIGCVAGWAVTLKRAPLISTFFNGDSVQATAADLLDLSTDQQSELFGVPDQFEGKEPQTRAYARMGVAHIRKFQKKYRAQLLKTKV